MTTVMVIVLVAAIEEEGKTSGLGCTKHSRDLSYKFSLDNDGIRGDRKRDSSTLLRGERSTGN